MVDLLGNEPVIIFGGSFNPPTIGHAFACQLLIETFPNVPIWILPSGDRRDKKIPISFEHRYAMCNLMIEEYFFNNIKVIDIENNYQSPTSTFDTLNILNQQNPNTTFWLACGTDIISHVGSWYNSKELCDIANWIVFERPTGKPLQQLDSSLVKSIIIENTMPCSISSSAVREKFSLGIPTKLFVGEKVYSYIQKSGLY